MHRSPATMKDVAARAGVSLSTVSYVLSGTRPISEATRHLIHRAMDELDYQPNAVARALASKRTRVIALVLSPHGRDLGLSELAFVRAATEAARALDHHLVLLTQGMESEADLAYLRGQGLIDGVVLMEVTLDDPRVPLLQKMHLPFSLLGARGPHDKWPYVDIDYDRTFALVVEHLHSLGHRRVGFITQSEDALKAGYGPVVRAQEALGRHATAAGWALTVAHSAASPRDGFVACRRLKQDASPTAFVVMNDRAVPGVLQALAAEGLRVPDDVSVVSVLTSPADAERLMPALTSADVPSDALARLAVSNLVSQLEGRAGVETVLLPCQFVPRESTGRCKESV